MATTQQVRRPTNRQREKSGLVFEAPATRTGGRPGIWTERMTQVQEFPGEWVRLDIKPNRQKANSLATNLRFIAKRRGGRWNIATRTLTDGTCAVYVRYQGA